MLRKLTVVLVWLCALGLVVPDTAEGRRRRRRRRRARISKKVKKKRKSRHSRRRRRRKRRRRKKRGIEAPRAPAPTPAAARPAGPAASPSTPSAGPGTPADGPASPETAAAKAKALALLQEGNKKVDAGIYLEALRLFQKAYALYPSPLIHFNIAQTYNELGKFIDALTHYELFVKKTKEDAARKRLRDMAHKRIFALLGKIGTVEVVANMVEAAVAADGRPVGKTPLKKAVRFMPGSHALVVTKPGYVKQVLDVKIAAGQTKTVRVKLMTEDEHARNLKVVKALEAKKRRLAANLKREQEEAVRKARIKRRALRISGWSTLGTGLALGIVGGVMGLMGQLEAKKVEEAGTTQTWNSIKKHYNNADTFRNVMYYAAPIGGALAITGAVLLGLGYRATETPSPSGGKSKNSGRAASVMPIVGPSNAGLVVRMNF